MIENAAVESIRNEQRDARDRGLVDGYESNPNLLPEFWFNKTISQLTPYERAYFVGREVLLDEMAEARKR